MSADKLVRMANQITSFFRSYPDDEARVGIRDHIVSFWTPKMRRELDQHLQGGGGGLDPLAAEALRPSGPNDGCGAVESPIRKEIAGPQEVGQLGSDAG